MAAGKTDISRMRKLHAALKTAGPVQRREMLREIATPLLRIVSMTAPRDTQRYVRAYEMAAKDIGIPLMVSPVKPGEFASMVLPRVQAQFNYWKVRKAQYESAGRTGEPYYRKKVLKKYNRAKDFLEKFSDTSIVIFGTADYKKETRVLDKVYGGTGQFVDVGSSTFIRLANKEPHARIVESRHFGMRQLIRAQRSAGLARAKGAQAKAIKAQVKLLGGK